MDDVVAAFLQMPLKNPKGLWLTDAMNKRKPLHRQPVNGKHRRNGIARFRADDVCFMSTAGQLFGQVVHVNFQTADLRQECVADDRNFQTFHDPKP